MPQRTFLYHSSNPRGQIFDLDEPGLAQTLAAEGWVDTPDKLRPEHRLNSTDEVVQPVPRETPVAVTAGAGGVLASAVVAAYSLLSSVEAKERIACLFDDDGTPRHAGLALEYLGKIIDAMSREELVFVAQVVGVEEATFDKPFSSDLRAAIALILRPDEMAPAAAVIEAMNKTADEDDVTTGIPIPARGGEISAEELGKLDEQGREAWLTHDDTTKEHLRAVLIAKGKTPKARDGKEELQEVIRLAYSE